MFEKLFRRRRASLRKKSQIKIEESYQKERSKSLDRGLTAFKEKEEYESKIVNSSIIEPLSARDLEFVDNQGMSREGNSFESLSDPKKNIPGNMFEDSVLEAIQIGNLSIADFLKSPHSSPNIKTTALDSSESIENKCLTNRTTSCNSNKVRSLSLLDKAHSQDSGKKMSPNNTNKIHPTVTLSKERSDPDLVNPELLAFSGNELDKSRFSKSLETLAQEVFGTEYQVYLNFASNTSTKIPIMTPLNELQKAKNDKNSLCVQNDTENASKKMLGSRAFTANEGYVMKLHKEDKTFLSLDLQANEVLKNEPLKSWNNAVDLRSSNLLGDGSFYMTSICQGKDFIFKKSKESHDLDDFSESLDESFFSITDIEFPPPPPLNDIDDDELSGSKKRLIEKIKYESGVPSFVSTKFDPLIESLISVIPLPEDHTKLVPVLTTALSEIVSEIKFSRQKLQRMFKVIEFHQQIFKEQNKKISSQAMEIMQLRQALSKINNISNILVPHYSTCNFNRRSENPRLNRQGNEVIELSDTLDKLIYQCAELQRTSNNDNGLASQECSLMQAESSPVKKLKRTHVIQTSTELE